MAYKNKEEKRQKDREYREKNRDKLKEKNREYYSNNLNKFAKYRKDNKEKRDAYNKEYKITAKEKIKETTKKYTEKNKERIAAKDREYYEKNKAKLREYSREYYLKNREAILEKKRSNQEKYKVALRISYNTNPQVKISYLLRNRIKKALKGRDKSCSTRELLGCSFDEAKLYLEKQFKKGMTWENHGEWHIDHVLPLSSFNLEDTVQQKLACHYTNLQPLWAKENLQKSAKLNYESEE